MIKPGIYKDLSNEDYHSDPAISRSGVMDFLESPYKYWASRLSEDRPRKDSTDAMTFGNAFHYYILEPDKYHELYAHEPIKMLLKDVGRETYDKYKKVLEELENTDKIVLSNKDFNTMLQMKIALQEHKEAWDLIQGATYEQSYFWEDEHSGIMCKARPDILHSNMIVDLKTCKSADSRAYQYAMIDGGYHIQGAMIREGIKQCTGVDIKTVINICVEKTYPYQIGIKIIGESALEAGHNKFKQALLDIKNCVATKQWPGYNIEIVELPNWAI